MIFKGKKISKAALRRIRKSRKENQDRILDRVVHGRKKARSVWAVGGGLPSLGKKR
jgi:hypothetical protein